MLFLALMALVGQAAVSPSPEEINTLLTIDVTGFQTITGDVLLSIFNSEDGFPKDADKAVYSASLPVTSNTVTFEIESLEPGTYAATVFHDEDSDGELDRRFYGPPAEKVGASNNARGRMGPPSFEDASFELGREPLETTITLQ